MHFINACNKINKKKIIKHGKRAIDRNERINRVAIILKRKIPKIIENFLMKHLLKYII